MTVEDLLDLLTHADPGAQVFVQVDDGDTHLRVVECFEGFLSTEGDGMSGHLTDDTDAHGIKALVFLHAD